MYLYKADNFFPINHYLKSVSKVALLHRFYCICEAFVDSCGFAQPAHPNCLIKAITLVTDDRIFIIFIIIIIVD